MTQIQKIDIGRELSTSFMDYSMSVIVSRSLVDVRDGLKPVHRRILFGMKTGGFVAGERFRKSAAIVGHVMGKYHPHGDSAIYDTMVRLAQPWTMGLPLIDGQGNFGSVDGDSPAAMRYTEARLMRVADGLLDDIDKDTVEFKPTYDGEHMEPTVLPAAFPHVLVNGSSGIAVGMASDIPSHNLGEVIDATLLLMANPGAGLDDIIAVMPGPDFPTAGRVIGSAGIRQAFETGQGRVTIEGVHHMEEGRQGRTRIVFTELPYQVSKSALQEKIAELVKEDRLDGIAAMRDESDRKGVRFVVEVRADADANVVLAHLLKLTPLRKTWSYNMTVIHRGRPVVMGVAEMIRAWIDFRRTTVRNRTLFDLGKARARLHILSGLLAALDNIDWVVDTIRAAANPAAAKDALMARDLTLTSNEARVVSRASSETPDAPLDAFTSFRFSEEQAQAILDMRLARLTGLEREKLGEEANGLVAAVADYIDILNNPPRLDAVIMDELRAIKAKYAVPRRSQIEAGELADVTTIDLIPRIDVMVTVTAGGYIKRQSVEAFRAQRKGGRGKSGMDLKADDAVTRVLSCTTHDELVAITSKGMAYRVPVHVLSDSDRGKALVNYLPQLEAGESIIGTVAMPWDADRQAEDALGSLMFVFSDGSVRRSAMKQFVGIRANGKRAVALSDDVTLVAVLPARDDQDLLLVRESGAYVRFRVGDLRVVGSRDSTGVRGIKVAAGEKVVAACVLESGAWTVEQRDAYLATLRRMNAGLAEDGEGDGDGETPATPVADIDQETFDRMAAEEQTLVMVTANSFGKRSNAYEYRTTNRGIAGSAAMKVSDMTGPMVACATVRAGDGLMLVTSAGQTIRLRADEVRKQGRATRGTRLFNLRKGEVVVAMVVLPADDDGIGSENDAAAADAGHQE